MRSTNLLSYLLTYLKSTRRRARYVLSTIKMHTTFATDGASTRLFEYLFDLDRLEYSNI